MLSTLATQAQLTDQARTDLQYRALLKFPPPTLPSTAGPQLSPQADSWGHNVTAFLRLLDTPQRSRNAYNEQRAHLLTFPVLGDGWTPNNLHVFGLGATPKLPARSAWPMAPGRGGLIVNESLIVTFGMILQAVGFDRNAPVLLDNQGRILDGYHRLMAALTVGVRAYFVQLDY